MGACTPLPMPDAGAPPPPPSDAGFTGIAGTGGGFLGSAGTTGSGASGGEATGTGTATGAAGSVGQQQIGGVCKCDTADGPGWGGVGLFLAAVGIALSRSRSGRLSRLRPRGR
jgi:hypothetical protein